MARRTKKTDDAPGSEAAAAMPPFVMRYVAALEQAADEFKGDLAAWLKQRPRMTDPAEMDVCDELIEGYAGILELGGAPPISLPALIEIASRIPTTFEMRRDPPRAGVKPPASPAPRNAWLIMGSESSWLDREQVDGINQDPRTANLFVEQSACTRTAASVHRRRGEPASRVRCARAWSPSF